MRGMSGDAQQARSFRRPVGRRGIAEVGREQHEPVERVAERAPGDAQREPAARRMADQRESGGRIGLAQFGDRDRRDRRRAGRDRRCRRASPRRRGRGYRPRPPSRRLGRERRRDGDASRSTGRRAVRQNRDPVSRSVRRRIEPVGEPGPVAGLEAAEVGRAPGVDLHRPFMYRGERRRRPHRPGQHQPRGAIAAAPTKASSPRRTWPANDMQPSRFRLLYNAEFSEMSSGDPNRAALSTVLCRVIPAGNPREGVTKWP